MPKTLHVRCPSCHRVSESTLIQLDEQEFEQTAIDGNVELCPHCGGTVQLTREAMFFA